MKYTYKINVNKDYLSKITDRIHCWRPEETCAIALIKTNWGDFRIIFNLPEENDSNPDGYITDSTTDPVEILENTLDKIIKRDPLKIL